MLFDAGVAPEQVLNSNNSIDLMFVATIVTKLRLLQSERPVKCITRCIAVLPGCSTISDDDTVRPAGSTAGVISYSNVTDTVSA